MYKDENLFMIHVFGVELEYLTLILCKHNHPEQRELLIKCVYPRVLGTSQP